MTTKLLKSSGLAALAAALAVSVLPQTSFARDNDRPGVSQRGGGDRGSARSSQSSPRAERSSPRSEARAERPSPSPRASRSEARGPSQAPQPRVADAPRPQREARNYTPPAQVAVPASRVETRAPRESAGRVAREGWAERRETVRTETSSRSAGNNASWADRRGVPDQRSGNDRDGRGRDGDRNGNWNGRDGDRDGRGRDGDRDGRGRDGNWGGRDGNRDGDRNGNWRGRDGDRDGNWRDRDGRGRDGNRDHRRWDNRWRDNDRYNWRHYRDRNRTVFNLGVYYAPYRNYYYSRIGVGFYLDSLFFGSRYWINDPWQYRLPEVYGPYRWVRYYDDVVLVDIYTGEVVDVIYDFFW
jgi:hypothetical protein